MFATNPALVLSQLCHVKGFILYAPSPLKVTTPNSDKLDGRESTIMATPLTTKPTTTIDDATLAKIFDASQADHVTTQAKYWIFSDGIKTTPTVFVPGENTIVLDGKPHVFKNGAFIYKADGKIGAVQASAADGGGITVDGGPVRPVNTTQFIL